MKNKYYTKLLEDSILRKIKTVPSHMFVYNNECGWNECNVDCLFSYEYKQPNGGLIVLYTVFNHIVDVNGERFIYSKSYGKLFDMQEKLSNGEKIYGRAEFSTYECLLKWIDKSLCSYDEHMLFVADEMEKIVSKYGKYIKNGIYFTDSSVSVNCIFKIASDIKYRCDEYQLVFYVDVETYDIDFKNSSLIKQEGFYYNEACIERFSRIKDSIIKDVRTFIEEIRTVKIKEIDEHIDILMRQRERLFPINDNKQRLY